jgi:hypothetical protein
MKPGPAWALAALATLASPGCGRNDNEPTPLLALTLGTYRVTTSIGRIVRGNGARAEFDLSSFDSLVARIELISA